MTMTSQFQIKTRWHRTPAATKLSAIPSAATEGLTSKLVSFLISRYSAKPRAICTAAAGRHPAPARQKQELTKNAQQTKDLKVNWFRSSFLNSHAETAPTAEPG